MINVQIRSHNYSALTICTQHQINSVFNSYSAIFPSNGFIMLPFVVLYFQVIQSIIILFHSVPSYVLFLRSYRIRELSGIGFLGGFFLHFWWFWSILCLVQQSLLDAELCHQESQDHLEGSEGRRSMVGTTTEK